MKIDLILPPTKRAGYGVLESFTRDLNSAFGQIGVESRILEPSSRLISTLIRDQPDYTLSFNGILPDPEGRWLCEMVDIPHIAYIVDSPNHFLELAKQSMNVIVTIDQGFAGLFERYGAERVCFLPHAVSREVTFTHEAHPEFGWVFFGTCFDVEAIEMQWQRDYSQRVQEVLHAAASLALEDPQIFYFDAFMRSAESHGLTPAELGNLSIPVLLQSLENKIRGEDRLFLLRNLEGIPVDVFGRSIHKRGWGELLRGSSVCVHDAIDYSQVKSIIRRSKGVLNSTPSIRYGAHERIFEAMAAGVGVVTSESVFLRNEFGGENFYIYGDVSSPQRAFKAEEELGGDKKESRCRAVIKHHTWIKRAEQLVAFLRVDKK